MSTLLFDTLEATRRLRDAGFDEKQAEAVVRVLADGQGDLVRKTDLSGLRDHIDSRFSVVDAKFDKLTWMLGVLIALAAANFARQFF